MKTVHRHLDDEGSAPRDEAQVKLNTFLNDFGGAREADDEQDLIYTRSLRTARARTSAFINWKNPDGNPLILACGFARQKEMNAVAGREDTVHCLAVFEPLMGAFFDFFTTILSVPAFLPEFGDASAERLERLTERKATLGFGYMAAARASSEGLEAMTLPRCPYRAHLALHMAHVAFDFIWCHEIWHAALGHVDYAQTLNIRALNEVPGENDDRRILPLEIEADQMASYWIADQAFQERTPYIPLQISLTPLQRTLMIQLALILTAYFWAHLQRIKVETSDRTGEEISTHPSPLVRLHFALQNMNIYLTKRRGLSEQDAALLHRELLAELDRLANSIDWFHILSPSIVFSDATLDSVKTSHHLAQVLREEMNETLNAFRYTA